MVVCLSACSLSRLTVDRRREKTIRIGRTAQMGNPLERVIYNKRWYGHVLHLFPGSQAPRCVAARRDAVIFYLKEEETSHHFQPPVRKTESQMWCNPPTYQTMSLCLVCLHCKSSAFCRNNAGFVVKSS